MRWVEETGGRVKRSGLGRGEVGYSIRRRLQEGITKFAQRLLSKTEEVSGTNEHIIN